jgi:LPXTG-site transpeptidase (sortase) family protein
MRRIALALTASLVAGASVGLIAHRGSAADSVAALPPAQPRVNEERRVFVPPRMLRQQVPVARVASFAPATIAIPRLQVRSRIFAPSKLDSGPAWWKITGRPGGGDTVAVAGHRTTHTRPFYFLERLRRGDRVYVAYRGRTYRYRVVSSRVVPSDNLHIADAVGHERLLLTTCTPRGSARSRLVVEALPD